jgi:hypothetical protein
LSVAEWPCFVAKSTYPRRFRVIQGDLTLSRPKQSYPRRNKVIGGKLTLSTANQGYPSQFNLICRKVSLSAANNVTLRQIGLRGLFRIGHQAGRRIGRLVRRKSVVRDLPAQRPVELRGFIENLEGWRPPCPRPPPSRAWRPAAGEGGPGRRCAEALRTPPDSGILAETLSLTLAKSLKGRRMTLSTMRTGAAREPGR